MKTYFFNSSLPYGANMYVLENGGEIAIIDPSRPFEDIYSLIDLGTKKIKYIFLTHAHFDHMLYLDDWTSKAELPVTLSEYDAPALSDSHLNCYKYFLNSDKPYTGEVNTVAGTDIFYLGEEKIGVLELPGHTPGSIAFFTEDDVFVGDTVFAGGGVGRCDLPGGNYKDLSDSIEKLRNFTDKNLNVYSGHGPKTTLSKI